MVVDTPVLLSVVEEGKFAVVFKFKVNGDDLFVGDIPSIESDSANDLSLIHISEPTRPY